MHKLCQNILSHSENRVQPIELHSERKVRTAIMSVLRFTKSRNTVWRPFYPLIRNNMTQNTVRDSRESPDKQQTGMLNRLAYLRYSKCSAQLHVYIISSIQEFHWCYTISKWVSSPLLNWAFSWNEIFVFSVGQILLRSQKGFSKTFIGYFCALLP